MYIPSSITSRGSEVMSIGGIITDAFMTPIKFFCHWCDTVAPCSEAAYEVHGISTKDVRTFVGGEFLPILMTRRLPEFFEENINFFGYNVEFDMCMVRQTLANSPLQFTWKKNSRPGFIPKSGRWSNDIASLYKIKGRFQPLSNFVKRLEPRRNEFISRWGDTVPFDSNCPELLSSSFKSHNAFYDSLNTFLLWEDAHGKG